MATGRRSHARAGQPRRFHHSSGKPHTDHGHDTRASYCEIWRMSSAILPVRQRSCSGLTSLFDNSIVVTPDRSCTVTPACLCFVMRILNLTQLGQSQTLLLFSLNLAKWSNTASTTPPKARLPSKASAHRRMAVVLCVLVTGRQETIASPGTRQAPGSKHSTYYVSAVCTTVVASLPGLTPEAKRWARSPDVHSV